MKHTFLSSDIMSASEETDFMLIAFANPVLGIPLDLLRGEILGTS